MPEPLPNHDTAPFWEGVARSEFLLPACAACGTVRWPPGPICPSCRAPGARWVTASGVGLLYSWVVVHHPVHPVLADQVPYVTALVELPEGIRVVANLADVEETQLVDGLPLELVFEHDRDGRPFPNFRPARVERGASE